jgi:hypothetical protein
MQKGEWQEFMPMKTGISHFLLKAKKLGITCYDLPIGYWKSAVF